MGCPNNASAGVETMKKKTLLEQPKFQPPSLLTTSGVAVVEALVVTILVGLPRFPDHLRGPGAGLHREDQGGATGPERSRRREVPSLLGRRPQGRQDPVLPGASPSVAGARGGGQGDAAPGGAV